MDCPSLTTLCAVFLLMLTTLPLAQQRAYNSEDAEYPESIVDDDEDASTVETPVFVTLLPLLNFDFEQINRKKRDDSLSDLPNKDEIGNKDITLVKKELPQIPERLKHSSADSRFKRSLDINSIDDASKSDDHEFRHMWTLKGESIIPYRNQYIMPYFRRKRSEVNSRELKDNIDQENSHNIDEDVKADKKTEVKDDVVKVVKVKRSVGFTDDTLRSNDVGGMGSGNGIHDFTLMKEEDLDVAESSIVFKPVFRYRAQVGERRRIFRNNDY